ncbi:ABC transporter ATP-binding protein, partial [Francisella tularensis subsp. holarctica]|nr:ABC transporter ATP-binding protein [Francisella tularensis subsp. holarctica]
MAQLKNNSLINCYNICLEYLQDNKLTKKVIEILNLSIRENEIIAIVG